MPASAASGRNSPQPSQGVNASVHDNWVNAAAAPGWHTPPGWAHFSDAAGSMPTGAGDVTAAVEGAAQPMSGDAGDSTVLPAVESTGQGDWQRSLAVEASASAGKRLWEQQEAADADAPPAAAAPADSHQGVHLAGEAVGSNIEQLAPGSEPHAVAAAGAAGPARAADPAAESPPLSQQRVDAAAEAGADGSAAQAAGSAAAGECQQLQLLHQLRASKATKAQMSPAYAVKAELSGDAGALSLDATASSSGEGAAGAAARDGVGNGTSGSSPASGLARGGAAAGAAGAPAATLPRCAAAVPGAAEHAAAPAQRSAPGERLQTADVAPEATPPGSSSADDTHASKKRKSGQQRGVRAGAKAKARSNKAQLSAGGAAGTVERREPTVDMVTPVEAPGSDGNMRFQGRVVRGALVAMVDTGASGLRRDRSREAAERRGALDATSGAAGAPRASTWVRRDAQSGHRGDAGATEPQARGLNAGWRELAAQEPPPRGFDAGYGDRGRSSGRALSTSPERRGRSAREHAGGALDSHTPGQPAPGDSAALAQQRSPAAQPAARALPRQPSAEQHDAAQRGGADDVQAYGSFALAAQPMPHGGDAGRARPASNLLDCGTSRECSAELVARFHRPATHADVQHGGGSAERSRGPSPARGAAPHLQPQPFAPPPDAFPHHQNAHTARTPHVAQANVGRHVPIDFPAAPQQAQQDVYGQRDVYGHHSHAAQAAAAWPMPARSHAVRSPAQRVHQMSVAFLKNQLDALYDHVAQCWLDLQAEVRRLLYACLASFGHAVRA
jgi:hypothetical protein